jgi:phosphoribosylanthranilate isomerase
LDSAHADNAGGTGKVHDWELSQKIVQSISTPIILAGGLNPENVAEAIRVVRPYAIDVRSGVSNSDGSKDLEKVRKFIAQAKSA